MELVLPSIPDGVHDELAKKTILCYKLRLCSPCLKVMEICYDDRRGAASMTTPARRTGNLLETIEA
ncbi:hypothetical protein CY34DRAFT_798781 [Suillus luteus UH-Slu-Lm8-n1]|uniref:Unplaced genomic scaffold CY34scaffold_11, whole genome shotgun sequence n=1 Tax=Suillus luteus UH-Slu-Lm8-n1 TaxID=930992 RepID=A0A0D0BQG4_9AGAM|nr:hypothetical protein CY34DRAFT_798781 [Suillus luteus UH-Slu-Lm8-n1]